MYSFGVVLLELISGRRAMDNSNGGNEYSLVDWATPYLGDKRKLFRIMDTKLGGQYPQKGAFTAANLALQCLNPDAKLRPKMSEVLITLEQLESVAKPGIKHTQMESPRSHHSSVVQKSPVRYNHDRPLLHNITPGASPLPSYNQSPRVR